MCEIVMKCEQHPLGLLMIDNEWYVSWNLVGCVGIRRLNYVCVVRVPYDCFV